MVAAYLTADPKIFISQQYKLIVPDRNNDGAKRKTQWPDIVAIRPYDNIAYLVEVTTAEKPKELAEKVARYILEEKTYLDVLKESTKHPFQKALPWVFLRHDARDFFCKQLRLWITESQLPRITDLEDVGKPWTYIKNDVRSDDED